MTDYYHVGLPSAISDNLLVHAAVELHVRELDWLADRILLPTTLQQFLEDHFKNSKKTRPEEQRFNLENLSRFGQANLCYQEVFKNNDVFVNPTRERLSGIA